MKNEKWNNNKNDIINTENLLKKQNYKCANNPNNFEYIGPRDYFCPQLKYNNGFLEKDFESDDDHIAIFANKKSKLQKSDNREVEQSDDDDDFYNKDSSPEIKKTKPLDIINDDKESEKIEAPPV